MKADRDAHHRPGRHDRRGATVDGVVSEADPLRKEEFRDRYYQDGYKPPLRARPRHRMSEEGSGTRRKAAGDTTAEDQRYFP